MICHVVACRSQPALHRLEAHCMYVTRNTGTESRQIKAKVGPKKVESAESEADTLPKSLHVFHGDDSLDFEV